MRWPRTTSFSLFRLVSLTAAGLNACGNEIPAERSQVVVLQRLPAATNGLKIPARVHRAPFHWSAESGMEMARFGLAMTAGDLDGDGFAEVVIGAPRAIATDLGTARGGQVLIFGGSAQGLSQNAPWSGQGPRESGFGRGLGILPRGTADLRPFLLVGAPTQTTERPRDGSVHVIEWRPGDGFHRWADPFVPGSASGLFGETMVVSGDMNGDGHADIAIGAPRATYQFGREGGVFLYRGSATGPVIEKPRWLWVGGQPDAAAGSAILPAGDVNRDGYDDIFVGMPGYDTDCTDAGRVALVLGSPAGPIREPLQTWDGDQVSLRFGAALALADLDGDGAPDLVVGAPGSEKARHLRGRVQAFRRTPAGYSTQATWTLESSGSGSWFGSSLAAVPDVNGDRLGELLVGDPTFDGAFPNEGRALLYLGRIGGPAAVPDWMVLGGQRDARCGWRVASASDVNGDGLGDFLVGSPFHGTSTPAEGRVDLFMGRTDGYRRGEAPLVDHISAIAGKVPGPPEPFGSVDSGTSQRRRSFGPLVLGLILILLPVPGWFMFHRWRLRGERLRIARDLHDQVGAHLVRLQSVPDTGSDHGPSRIQETVEALSLAMERAVWSVDPRRDTLESLVSFLGHLTEKSFAGTGIRCLLDLPEVVPDIRVKPRVRREILHCFQEALTNLFKHSGASNAGLKIECSTPSLAISIEDDGRGFNGRPETATGNGLRNLRERMQGIGGTCVVGASPKGGARISLTVILR